MRTITALLRAVCLLAPAADAGLRPLWRRRKHAKAEQKAGGGEEVKVLGFTFGKPPPAEAVLASAAGRYRNYELKHRWCDELIALTDNGRVVSVRCIPNDPDAMLSLLKSRYGSPQERGGTSTWFTPYGTAILTSDSVDMYQWVRATTRAEISATAKTLEQATLALLHATEAEIGAEIAERENAEGEDF